MGQVADGSENVVVMAGRHIHDIGASLAPHVPDEVHGPLVGFRFRGEDDIPALEQIGTRSRDAALFGTCNRVAGDEAGKTVPQ